MKKFVSTGTGALPPLQQKSKGVNVEKEDLQGRRTPRSEVGEQKEELFIPLKNDGNLAGKNNQTT